MKNKRTIIVLAVVLAVLLGGYFLLRGLHLGEEAETPLQDSISLKEVGEVSSIAITYQGVTSSFEQAENGDWVCLEDDTLELDQDRMQNMAEQVVRITASQLVTNEMDRLNEFGLDEPACRVEVTGLLGSYTLLLGDHQDFNDTYYGQIEGEQAVYSLPASLASSVCVERQSLKAPEDTEE